jgi:hypothetical protein
VKSGARIRPSTVAERKLQLQDARARLHTTYVLMDLEELKSGHTY